MICFDREFPETARLLMLEDAEVVVVPNACVLDDLRLAQFQTRAFENCMVMAMANYSTPTCNGRSVAFMVDGSQIALAGSQEDLILVDLPLDRVRELRRTSLWGNAFRRPKRYWPLSQEKRIETFLRTNAFGEAFDPSTR
jgi:predicted amidohydrolase